MSNLKIITFPDLPVHDTIWSITTGSDGKVYMGICGELTGGLSVFLVSYSPVSGETEYVMEVAKELNEPPDNGKATHSKIHTCLIGSRDGKLYIATHCTGAPVNHRVWRPWNCWDDNDRMFSGFHIACLDLKTRDFVDFGIQSPNEGSRIMALGEKRGLLYGVTYPRCHFYVYDIKRRKYTDIGRFGEVNPQSMWLDKDENFYTIDDMSYVVKYMADTQELIHTEIRFPFLHEIPSVTLYDAVPSPDGKDIYGVTWNEDTHIFMSRLFRYNFEKEKIYDLGPVDNSDEPINKHHHTGGLVFGDDDYLYCTAGWTEYTPQGGLTGEGASLYRMNVKTLKKEKICDLVDHDGIVCPYIHHATKDFAGRLYFGESNFRPPRLFCYSPDYVKDTVVKPRLSVLKPWG